MASNETSKYKLSVVEGTELQLSLSGAQGPAGTVNYAAPDPIGNGTPNTGAFTTLSATGAFEASNSSIKLSQIPTFANNTAASSLAAGSVYKTSTGELRIKY